jgi:hypothetical protein
MEAIVSGAGATAIELLEASPQLARERAAQGATRQTPKRDFFDQILHHMYAGDSALHIAAAAYQPVVVGKLIAMGADIHARNRRGAMPLHYAVDGGPGLPAWNPTAQSEIGDEAAASEIARQCLVDRRVLEREDTTQCGPAAREPDWMKISPVAGSLFHEKEQVPRLHPECGRT